MTWQGVERLLLQLGMEIRFSYHPSYPLVSIIFASYGTVLRLDKTGQFFFKKIKINNQFKSVVAVPRNQCAVLGVAIDIARGRSSD